MMSEENVEIVRRIYVEWERGNLAAAVEWFDPEIAFETFMPDASENVVVPMPPTCVNVSLNGEPAVPLPLAGFVTVMV